MEVTWKHTDDPNAVDIVAPNDQIVGQAIRGSNGFFMFYPLEPWKCFSSWDMIAISKVIKELNDEYVSAISIGVIGSQLYHYEGVVDRVVDGDTVDVTLDLGFSTFRKMRLRLNRINAPEMKGAESQAGKRAKEFLTRQVYNQRVIVKTEKDATDKYGRYLADLFVGDDCLNDLLVQNGLADYASYSQVGPDN